MSSCLAVQGRSNMDQINRSISAEFAPEEDGGCRGMAMMICPTCGKRERELYLEHIYEMASENSVEFCTSCREEFEGDNDIQFDSDTQPTDIYDKLFAFASVAATRVRQDQRGLKSNNAGFVAQAMGGQAMCRNGEWVIVKETHDGRIVTHSPETVLEYDNREAFVKDQPTGRMATA